MQAYRQLKFNLTIKFHIKITGSGHGIGKQLALQYSKCGAIVICVDINEQSNKETVKEIQARGGKAYPYVYVIGYENMKVSFFFIPFLFQL